jgi:hypothetical protein
MNTISDIYSILSNGLNSAGEHFADASEKIAQFGSGATGSDDLSGTLMNLMADKLTYDANAKALKMAHQTLGTMMDVLDTPLRA